MTIRRCENCKYYKSDNPYGGDINEYKCTKKNKYTRSNDGCLDFEIKKKVIKKND
jgi:hypothetical protein